MSFVKEAIERTNKVARKWTESGKRFGFPSSDRVAEQWEENGRKFIKKTGGK